MLRTAGLIYVLAAVLCLPAPFVGRGIGYSWTFQYGALPLGLASASLALTVGRKAGAKAEVIQAVLWGLCALSISLPVSAWAAWRPFVIWTEAVLLTAGAAALFRGAVLLAARRIGPGNLSLGARATMAGGVVLLALIMTRAALRWVVSMYATESAGLASMFAYAREFQISVLVGTAIIVLGRVLGIVWYRPATISEGGV